MQPSLFVSVYYKILLMTDRIRKIAENIKALPYCWGGARLFDEELSLHTTMHVGGRAALFAEPSDAASLRSLIRECRRFSVPFFTLGGGSNVIASDEGYPGVIISTTSLNSIEVLDGTLVCGAGVAISRVVDLFAERGARGMEKFAGLPGTTGGACYMNARCYSQDICSMIDYVEYISVADVQGTPPSSFGSGLKVYHNATDASWGYKKSPFMDMGAIITRVAFRLPRGDASLVEEIKAEGRAYIQDRVRKGHFRCPSAGSVFKNNRDFHCPTGKLIDDLGLKGEAVGGAEVAPWHGNIIINTGGATARDVRELAEKVRARVRDATGYNLEYEVVFI